MKDKCGVEIEVGDIIDYPCDNVMTGLVLEVSDGGIQGPDGKPSPAVLKVSIPGRMNFTPGFSAPVYVIRKNPDAAAKKGKK